MQHQAKLNENAGLRSLCFYIMSWFFIHIYILTFVQDIQSLYIVYIYIYIYIHIYVYIDIYMYIYIYIYIYNNTILRMSFSFI